jgi:hypothetical protein
LPVTPQKRVQLYIARDASSLSETDQNQSIPASSVNPSGQQTRLLIVDAKENLSMIANA